MKGSRSSETFRGGEFLGLDTVWELTGQAKQRTVTAADGNCLILQIEEMKHRETTGWLIVEMKVEAMCFDFQST